jgi:hypothetical protein
MEKKENKASTSACLTHISSQMFRPWLPVCNRSLEPFPNPDRRLLYSPALGEIAVRDDDRISFWRMSHGGRVIKFVARIQIQGGPSACYAGTCLFAYSWTVLRKAVTLMSRHDRGYQDFFSVQIDQAICDIGGHGDLLAILLPSATTVYQQRAGSQFVVLSKIIIGFSALDFMPFVCLVPGWQTTICDGYESRWDFAWQECVIYFRIYRTLPKTSAFNYSWSREYVEESSPVNFSNRFLVWVHECMGVLSVLDVRVGASRRPRFMFSCQPEQYAFTHNVSDVKQAWMGACVQ